MRKLVAVAVGIVAVVVATALWSYGTALTDERDTPERTGDFVSLTQGSNTIYAGAIVAVNASNLAVPGATTAGLEGVGRAEVTSDNTGANYSATKAITVKRGVFRWASATNAISDADIGDMVYMVDDQTRDK
jgi:hypothetical protein